MFHLRHTGLRREGLPIKGQRRRQGQARRKRRKEKVKTGRARMAEKRSKQGRQSKERRCMRFQRRWPKGLQGQSWGCGRVGHKAGEYNRLLCVPYDRTGCKRAAHYMYVSFSIWNTPFISCSSHHPSHSLGLSGALSVLLAALRNMGAALVNKFQVVHPAETRVLTHEHIHFRMQNRRDNTFH